MPSQYRSKRSADWARGRCYHMYKCLGGNYHLSRWWWSFHIHNCIKDKSHSFLSGTYLWWIDPSFHLTTLWLTGYLYTVWPLCESLLSALQEMNSSWMKTAGKCHNIAEQNSKHNLIIWYYSWITQIGWYTWSDNMSNGMGIHLQLRNHSHTHIINILTCVYATAKVSL